MVQGKKKNNIFRVSQRIKFKNSLCCQSILYYQFLSLFQFIVKHMYIAANLIETRMQNLLSIVHSYFIAY